MGRSGVLVGTAEVVTLTINTNTEKDGESNFIR